MAGAHTARELLAEWSEEDYLVWASIVEKDNQLFQLAEWLREAAAIRAALPSLARLGGLMSEDAALARAREVLKAWAHAEGNAAVQNYLYESESEALVQRVAAALRTYGDERERAVAPTHCNICMYDPCACLALDERAAEQRERDAQFIKDRCITKIALCHCVACGIAAALRAQEEKA